MKRHPYLISTIEMRIIWKGIEYLKSAARLMDRDYVNRRGLDLSKKVLRVSVGQRVAELPAIKVGDLEKNSATSSSHTNSVQESSSIFKTFYSQSKYPHFNSTY